MTIDTRAAVLDLVGNRILNENAYQNLSQNIQKKLNESTPVASDFLSQETLTKIHEEYQTTLNESLSNLQDQYDLGTRLIKDLSAVQEPSLENLTRISILLHTFEAAIRPIRNLGKNLEEEVTQLEATIVSLI